MIHVFGTSHVSEQSLDLVEEKIEEIDPEIVALELDPVRLNALLKNEKNNSGNLFPRIIKKFQDTVGSKTGVMPGDEMLYAYEIAVQDGRDIALVDRDIGITLDRLNQVSRKEKVKAVIHLAFGLLVPGRMNMKDIPKENMVDELLEDFQKNFPELYEVLVEERNNHMIQALKKLSEENEEDIVAFIGAGHKKAVSEGVKSEIDI